MKYAIYGAGSLGIVLAAKLKNTTKKEVIVIDRNIKSVEALNNNGAIVVGTTQFKEKVTAILDTQVKDQFDIIFLMTKQLGNREAIQKITKFLSKEGVICTMQNGLPEQEISEIIGPERTFGCPVSWGATRIKPGTSELTSSPSYESLSFNIGNYSSIHNEYLDEIKKILSNVGKVTVDENLIGGRWGKLLINSSLSGLNSVFGGTFGSTISNPQERAIVLRVIKEGINVAHAANIKIEKIQNSDIGYLFDYHNSLSKQFCFSFLIKFEFNKWKKLKASMLQDIEKGIPCEVDYINGIVCKFGKKYDVQTPFNDKVVEIIHKIEKKELTSCSENVDLFDEILKQPEKDCIQFDCKKILICIGCILILVFCVMKMRK